MFYQYLLERSRKEREDEIQQIKKCDFMKQTSIQLNLAKKIRLLMKLSNVKAQLNELQKSNDPIL